VSSLDPVDPEDAFIEEVGGTGLVSLRGANLFSGYWPDGARGRDTNGWFRTGDVGYLDADGDLYLVDRANDLILVAGFTVYPHEVENVIDELPDVVEVAVIGVVDQPGVDQQDQDNRGSIGESVKAVVRTAAGSDLTEQQIIDHCSTRLAVYKVPRMVEFVNTLPHSATGKLRRVKLRE
jgi:long-chain acyl-CoA synthetase